MEHELLSRDCPSCSSGVDHEVYVHATTVQLMHAYVAIYSTFIIKHSVIIMCIS